MSNINCFYFCLNLILLLMIDFPIVDDFLLSFRVSLIFTFIISNFCTNIFKVFTNRQVISAIIKVIIVCGQQNIPLRGHRDFGKIDVCGYGRLQSAANDGNFRSLLRLMISCGDETLKSHMASAPKMPCTHLHLFKIN